MESAEGFFPSPVPPLFFVLQYGQRKEWVKLAPPYEYSRFVLKGIALFTLAPDSIVLLLRLVCMW